MANFGTSYELIDNPQEESRTSISRTNEDRSEPVDHDSDSPLTPAAAPNADKTSAGVPLVAVSEDQPLPTVRPRLNIEMEPKPPLHRSIKSFLASLAIHLVPTIITVGIISLSIVNIYWFDNNSSTDTMQLWRRFNLSLNELLNALQFAAKIHELLLLASLSSIVLHFIRLALVGNTGVPFGWLTFGYRLGSATYLYGDASRALLFTKRWWPFGILVVICTIYANTLGPASAIVILPNLDWWSINQPFGKDGLPIYVFETNQSVFWPQELHREHALRYDDPQFTDACFNSDYSILAECPATGWSTLRTWAWANSREYIPANVTMSDDVSDARRTIISRMTERDNSSYSGVAISTSVGHPLTTVTGSFWEFVSALRADVSSVSRPRMKLQQPQEMYQPLVQVQCNGISLALLETYNDTRGLFFNTNTGINTFSTANASKWPVPDWLYDYNYRPVQNYSNRFDPNDPNLVYLDDRSPVGYYGTMKSINATKLIWQDYHNRDDFNLSIAAVVITPIPRYDDTGMIYQDAMAHACSVDARWIASSSLYDPMTDRVLLPNVTDPLLFQRSTKSTPESITRDIERWGVSPPISIGSDWAEALSLFEQVEGWTTEMFSGFLGPFVETIAVAPASDGNQTMSANASLLYSFIPSTDLGQNSTASQQEDVTATLSSELIARLLSLFLTDALARVGTQFAQGYSTIRLNNATSGNSSYVALSAFAGAHIWDNVYNFTEKDLAEQSYTMFSFSVEKYGYGYGFRNATVIIGASILLLHTLIALIYMSFAVYDFVWGRGWTSSAWSNMDELAALLLNSPPPTELQKSYSGIESRDTWKKTVRIREIDDSTLGIVVGDEHAKHLSPVRTFKIQ